MLSRVEDDTSSTTGEIITWYRFLTLILIPILNCPSDQVPFAFWEMVPEHQRASLTMKNDLLEVSTDTKVD